MSQRIGSLPLDAFVGGSANGYNGKFTMRLPVGTTYRDIKLSLSNLLISQLVLISLTLNGDEIYRTTGTALDKLRKTLGLYTDANTVVIPFADMSQDTIASQNMSELIVGANENLVLKIETGAQTAGQATAAQADPSLGVGIIEGRMEFSTLPRPAGRMMLPRLFTDTLGGNRAGDNRFKGLLTQNKSGNPSKLQRFILDTGRAKRVRLYQNKMKTFDKTLAENDFDLKAEGVTQQNNQYCYNAVAYGYSEIDALSVPNDFEVVAELSSAGDFDIFYQTLEKVA